MSTEFYWDKERKKLIFTRYSGGIENIDRARHMRYVFKGKDNLVEFLQSEAERIIWDEHGIPWTVGSMFSEIRRHGVIVIEIPLQEDSQEDDE